MAKKERIIIYTSKETGALSLFSSLKVLEKHKGLPLKYSNMALHLRNGAYDDDKINITRVDLINE